MVKPMGPRGDGLWRVSWYRAELEVLTPDAPRIFVDPRVVLGHVKPVAAEQLRTKLT